MFYKLTFALITYFCTLSASGGSKPTDELAAMRAAVEKAIKQAAKERASQSRYVDKHESIDQGKDALDSSLASTAREAAAAEAETAAIQRRKEADEAALRQAYSEKKVPLNEDNALDLAAEEYRARTELEKLHNQGVEKFQTHQKWLNETNAKVNKYFAEQRAIEDKQVKLANDSVIAKTKTTPELEVTERAKLMEDFKKGVDAINQKQAQLQMINLKFPSGATLPVRRDVLALIPYFVRQLSTGKVELTVDVDILPSALKKICDFLGVSLTKVDVKGNILSDPQKVGKYKYSLFVPVPNNMVEFVYKNKELLLALKEIGLSENIRHVTQEVRGNYGMEQRITSYASDYKYSEVPKNNTVQNLILNQLVISSAFDKTQEIFTTAFTLLEKLKVVSPEKIPGLCNFFGELSRGITGDDNVRLLDALLKINERDYQNFIHVLNALLHAKPNDNRLDMVYALVRLNPDLYEFLQMFIAHNQGVFSRISFYELNNFIRPTTNQQQLTEWFQQAEERLAQQQQRDANRLYFNGLDVHNGARDSDSTTAIRLLISHQVNVNKHVFLNNYENFVKEIDVVLDRVIAEAQARNADLQKAIENRETPDLKKAELTKQMQQNNKTIQKREADKVKVKQVLGIKGVPQTGGFGAFLNGNISSYDLPNMDPKEFLGRLWYFTTQLPDDTSDPENPGKDRVNAQISLMTGLADSIDSNGSLVCNPGKLQRMVIGVLQGRLAGVNIDKVDMQVALSAEQIQAVDEAILSEYLKFTSVNPDRLFNKSLKWDSALEESVKSYIATRTKMVGSMLAKTDVEEALGRDYASADEVNTAFERIIQHHPDIAKDRLLSEYLRHQLLGLVVEVEEAAADAAAAQQRPSSSE